MKYGLVPYFTERLAAMLLHILQAYISPHEFFFYTIFEMSSKLIIHVI